MADLVEIQHMHTPAKIWRAAGIWKMEIWVLPDSTEHLSELADGNKTANRLQTGYKHESTMALSQL